MMNTEPIIIERTYDAPVAMVWSALTHKEEMKQWCFDIPDFEPVVGYEFTFEGGEEGKNYTHLCTVTEVVPLKKLAYTWRFKGYDGDSLVTYELYAEGDKTRLKLKHEGVDNFDKSVAGFAKENFVTGWTEIMGEMLRKHLDMQQQQN